MAMDLLLLGVIALALLLVILMIIYLVDRINVIERATQEAVRSLGQQQGPAPAGPFGALSGKALWDAMTGDGAGIDPMEASMLRQRYESVLSRHIEALFEEGRKDGQAGSSNRPQNTRRINTVRGSVESWLPGGQAQTLYQCGHDFATKGPGQWAAVRIMLDDAVSELYARAQIEPRGRLSDTLMGPDPDAGLASQTPVPVAAGTLPLQPDPRLDAFKLRDLGSNPLK